MEESRPFLALCVGGRWLGFNLEVSGDCGDLCGWDGVRKGLGRICM